MHGCLPGVRPRKGEMLAKFSIWPAAGTGSGFPCIVVASSPFTSSSGGNAGQFSILAGGVHEGVLSSRAGFPGFHAVHHRRIASVRTSSEGDAGGLWFCSAATTVVGVHPDFAGCPVPRIIDASSFIVSSYMHPSPFSRRPSAPGLLSSALRFTHALLLKDGTRLGCHVHGAGP